MVALARSVLAVALLASTVAWADDPVSATPDEISEVRLDAGVAPEEPAPEPAPTEVAPPPPQFERLMKPVGAIVPASEGNAFLPRMRAEQAPYRFWTPTAREVARFEQLLPAYLKQAGHLNAGVQPDLWRRIGRYRRQYVGTFAWGRKRLVVFLFDAPDSEQIGLVRPFRVAGGGDHFLHIAYGVESETFVHLDVNGAR